MAERLNSVDLQASPSSSVYQRIDDHDRLLKDENDIDFELPLDKSSKSRDTLSRVFKFLFKAIVTMLALWTLLNLSKKFVAFASPPKAINCNCGASVAEAINNGCKFDAMSTSWLPNECRDDELSEQFNKAGPGGSWTYYTDQAGNQTLSLYEVSMLADKEGDEAAFWVTHEWHVNHCLFYWRKESKARKFGLHIEKSFESDHHVSHCGDIFKSCRPLNEINTVNTAGLNSDLGL